MTYKVKKNNTVVEAIKGDITAERVDAIVNAANSGLMGGGGVDGAIHRAGGDVIKQECQEIISRIGRLPAGKVVVTSGGKLPAKYVIHTVGPVWRGGYNKEAEILSSCYTESLKLADSMGLSSIAFPAISTGVYGYPPELAATVAIQSVINFLDNTATGLTLIKFVLYDENSFNIYKNELTKLCC